jgi:hypothetical protein
MTSLPQCLLSYLKKTTTKKKTTNKQQQKQHKNTKVRYMKLGKMRLTGTRVMCYAMTQ